MAVTNATATPAINCVVKADSAGHISISWIADNAVTLAKIATQANNTILGNKSGATAAPSALSASDVRTVLGLATGDSPTFAGLTVGSLSGIVKAASGVLSAATAGTDYIAGAVGTAGYMTKFSALGTVANSPVYTDGTNIALGLTSPLSKFHISSNSGSDGITIDNYRSGGTPDPYLLFRSARGTSSSPSATQSGDELFWIGGRGYGDDSFAAFTKVGVVGYASQNWTNSNQGTYLTFLTTGDNTTSRAERVRITADGNMLVGTYSFGSSATKVFGIGSGTAPGSSPADMVQLYSADFGGTAGKAALHIRNESGVVIALGQQSHIADPTTDTTSLQTAVKAILTALETIGLLATS